MSLFLEVLRDAFKIYYNYNDDVSEEELLEYIKLNRNKVQYVWIDEFKKWLKELREVIERIKKRHKCIKIKKEDEIDLLEWRFRLEKKSMKDNDTDEYFQDMELDNIK